MHFSITNKTMTLSTYYITRQHELSFIHILKFTWCAKLFTLENFIHLFIYLFFSILILAYVLFWVHGFAGKLEYFEELSSCNSKKLRVFYSDPFDYHSIMDALKGCSGLFYSFEPPSDQPNYDVCSCFINTHSFSIKGTVEFEVLG